MGTIDQGSTTSRAEDDASGLAEILALSYRDEAPPRRRVFATFDNWLAHWVVNPQDAFIVRHMMGLVPTVAFAAWANFHASWWSVLLVYLAIILNGEVIGRFLQ